MLSSLHSGATRAAGWGPRLRRLAGTLALIGGFAGGASAQVPFDTPPKRPKLAAEADTNSALAYFNHGMGRMGVDPLGAAAAFYWASRIDPSWALPLYAERTALLLARPPADLTTYLSRRREALDNPDLQRIDSLALRALVKNPFVDRRLDGMLLSTWLSRATGNETTLRDLGSYDRRFTAWSAYLRGDYPMAMKVFGELMKRSPKDPDLRFWRAMTQFSKGQLDSARLELQSSVTLQRETEVELPGYGWVSHAWAEYAVGLLFSLTGQPDSARAAYERALLDDVRLHSAHYQLGKARLVQRDTVAALAEYQQAVALDPGDASYLADLGVLLIVKGSADSGIAVLNRAIATEPWFATPHFSLGLVYEQAGLKTEAAQHFEQFILLAPQNMGPAIASAKRHLAAIKRE